MPVIGSRYSFEALGLPVKTPWTSWYYEHQVELFRTRGPSEYILFSFVRIMVVMGNAGRREDSRV